MKPKFEIGDRVRIKDTHVTGEIINVASFAGVYLVLLDEVHTSLSFPEHKLEFTNPIAAFLARLQELLATFDAVINVGWNNGWQADDAEYPLIDMDVVFKDGTGFCYDNVLGRSITAENVFDYDKD